MSVEELQSAVAGLPADELARFAKWFEEFIADAWDRQIEQDMRAGRFDAALKRADEHYERGEWYLISKSGLARAYSDDEPDYPASLVRERAALVAEIET
jgi:hypothetical protein